MGYRWRGELWFNSGLNGKNAYFKTTKSFEGSATIPLEAGKPYIQIDHPNGCTVIFYLAANQANVDQQFFGTRSSSGCEHGATGVFELDTPDKGIFLFRVLNGDAVYDSSTQLVRFSLYTAPPTVP